MDFHANALRMLAGTLIAQALPLVATPLLSRIYEPEAFALQFLFMSFASALGVLATFRLELAMVMAPTGEEARSLAGLILMTTAGLCILQMLVLSAGAADIAAIAGFGDNTSWLWLLPVFTLAFSVFHVSTAFASRRHLFGPVASAGATLQVTYVGSALMTAAAGALLQGLAAAKLFGQVVAAASLTFRVRSDWSRLHPGKSLARAPDLLRKNSQFIVYNTPYSLSGGLLRDMPLYCLSTLATAALAGHFALARMVVMAPAALVSAGFGPVFFREAIASKGTSHLQTLTLRLLRSGGIATAPLFAALMIWGDILFTAAFGEAWATSGHIAMILAPAAWWAVQTSWPDRLFEVYARQGVSLAIQILADVTTATVFVITLLFSGDLEWAVAAFAVCNLAYHHGYLGIVCLVSGLSSRSIWSAVGISWLIFVACTIPQALARRLLPESLLVAACATAASVAVCLLLSYRLYLLLADMANRAEPGTK